MNRNEPPSLLRNDAPSGKPLAEGPHGGNEEQSQRKRRLCAGEIRRKSAGAMRHQPVKLSFFKTIRVCTLA
jgi:hypothetical protein